jgi:hypothetical protein
MYNVSRVGINISPIGVRAPASKELDFVRCQAGAFSCRGRTSAEGMAGDVAGMPA